MIRILLICLLFLCPIVLHAQQKGKNLSFTSSYEFSCPGNTNKIQLTIVVPRDIPGRQKVEKVTYSREPQKIYFNNNTCYADFLITSPASKEKILMEADITIYRSDYKTLSKQNSSTEEEITPYLKSEKHIESDDELILKKAGELQGKDRLETVRNIYDYVNGHIKYVSYIPQSLGARTALITKRGDCTEFSDLFIALCRASNIPARIVSGFTTDWNNTPCHGWTEVHFEKIGWIPFDPTPGNCQQFNKLTNRYIYLSNVRNDNILNDYEIYYFRYWGDKVEIKHSLKVRKR